MILAKESRFVSQKVLDEITTECLNQDDAKAHGKFTHTCDELSPADNLLVLAEEFGEWAEDVYNGKMEHARQELVQLVACGLRALQSATTEDRFAIQGKDTQYEHTKASFFWVFHHADLMEHHARGLMERWEQRNRKA